MSGKQVFYKLYKTGIIAIIANCPCIQMTKLTENLTLLSEELSAAKKYLQKKSDLPPLQAKEEKSKITEFKKKFPGDLELHKGSLGDVDGVKLVVDQELRDWKAEALQSRDELQAKTSQVKAYKKQVDQLKEISELQNHQVYSSFSLESRLPQMCEHSCMYLNLNVF